jgi:hypothetical protein
MTKNSKKVQKKPFFLFLWPRRPKKKGLRKKRRKKELLRELLF